MIIINNLEDFKYILSSIDNGDYSNISLNDIIVTLYDNGRIEFNAEYGVNIMTLSPDNEGTIRVPNDWTEILTASSHDDGTIYKAVVDHYKENTINPSEQYPLQFNAKSLEWMIEK